MLNTRDTVVAEKRSVCIWLPQEYYILKRWRNGSKRNRKGIKKKRQPKLEQGKPRQCGLGNGSWLARRHEFGHYD